MCDPYVWLQIRNWTNPTLFERSELLNSLCNIDLAANELSEYSVINLVSFGSDKHRKETNRKILLNPKATGGVQPPTGFSKNVSFKERVKSCFFCNF